MPLSIELANIILQQTLGYSQTGIAPNVYLGFLIDKPTFIQPTPNSGFTASQYREPYRKSNEVEDNGYKRVLIGSYGAANMRALEIAGGSAKNTTQQIVGTECLHDWTPISCFALFKSPSPENGTADTYYSGSDLLYWGYLQDEYGAPITTKISITQGQVPVFRVTNLQLSYEIDDNSTPPVDPSNSSQSGNEGN